MHAWVLSFFLEFVAGFSFQGAVRYGLGASFGFSRFPLLLRLAVMAAAEP